MTSKVLSLDLSTTCTGYSIFEGKELKDYGIIKPKVKGISNMIYPNKQYRVCINIIEQLETILVDCNPEVIVIEEINRHRNRMAGKTLDILHGFVWWLLGSHEKLDKVMYMDSDGATGWRKRLKLVYSDADRLHNKEAKKLNKSLGRGQKIPEVTKKTLAQRFVNKTYGTTFNVDETKTDADICDSIGLGHAFIHYVL